MQSAQAGRSGLQPCAVWVAALRGLNSEQTPNLPPHIPLESLAAEEVKDKVVRAIRGHKDWTSSTGPIPTRHLSVRFPGNRVKV